MKYQTCYTHVLWCIMTRMVLPHTQKHTHICTHTTHTCIYAVIVIIVYLKLNLIPGTSKESPKEDNRIEWQSEGWSTTKGITCTMSIQTGTRLSYHSIGSCNSIVIATSPLICYDSLCMEKDSVHDYFKAVSLH